jgi:hypothetical protein
MKAIGLLALLVLSSPTWSQDEKETWPAHSSPNIVSTQFVRRLEALPLSGENALPHTGWSDDYWGYQRGSINRRWNTASEQGFNLNSPSLAQAKTMSESDLAQLAPTEKYDLWRGRYDYPTVRRVALKANPEAAEWTGICNGWSPASLNLKEPRPVTLTNPDGISIPFGSSDVKALLSYYYAHDVKAPTRQVGRRCTVERGFSLLARNCGDDLNAGAFHIIMTNKLGLEQRGFIADVDRFKEVWNQPITAFTSVTTPTRRSTFGAARGTVREVLVRTDLHYAREINPQWEAVLGTIQQADEKLELEYTLELNERGEIVGGKWKSQARPDFIWFRVEAPFVGDFAELGEIYQAATQY